MAVDKLVLPRPDWYDEQGRIYKDALIENFNAIEAKCNEVSKLSVFDVQLPDFSTFDFDDTTIDSPDNKVVNLRSFLQIMNLYNVPFNGSFTGTTCNNLDYYKSDNTRVNISNKEIEGLGKDDKNYIYLRPNEETLYASADTSNPDNDILVGVYKDSIVYSINNNLLTDINILLALSNMQRDYIKNWSFRSGGWAVGPVRQYNRDYGYYAWESRGATLNVNWTDTGRNVGD